MGDQSSVANRHIGSRSLLSGPTDSLAGVIPDELDAGALCYVIENATVYQWVPGDSSIDNSPYVIRPTGRPNAGAWKPSAGVPATHTISVPLNMNAFSYDQAVPVAFPDGWALLFFAGLGGDSTVFRQSLTLENADMIEALFTPNLPGSGRILSIILQCEGRGHSALPATLPTITLLAQPGSALSPTKYPTAGKTDPSATLVQYETQHTITIGSVVNGLGANGLTIDPSARYIVKVEGEGGANAVDNGFDLYSLILTVAP